MNCPQCGQKLGERSLLDTPVAFCDVCSGWWFEPADAKAVVRTWKNFPDASNASPKKWREALSSCPRCGVPLVGFFHPAYNTVVKAEKCRKCDGFWLEDGEIRRLSIYRENIDKDHRPGREETPAARYLKKIRAFAIIATAAIILLGVLFLYIMNTGASR